MERVSGRNGRRVFLKIAGRGDVQRELMLDSLHPNGLFRKDQSGTIHAGGLLLKLRLIETIKVAVGEYGSRAVGLIVVHVQTDFLKHDIECSFAFGS